ncbi:MAG: class I SAM-dependent methyltransferase [Sulfuriferula sp.]
MSDGFYRAFEKKYRGTREVIKSRLGVYLPFVSPLIELDKNAKTIDLGCGRGEWLELMAEIGFKPYGIDLDEDMLSDCLALGLPAEKGDAVAYLTKLPSESQAVVSAFHVVEHISFEQLRTVVAEALRVLKPGGLLIMETPNPENIVVATRNFYLDPTHLRPIPSQLLSFLPEYYGFARIKAVRLQESKELLQSTLLTFHDVLGGVSPDYAVIAQKAGAPEIVAATVAAFEADYGLSLETLANGYDQQAEARATELKILVIEVEAKAQQAEAKALQAEAKAQQAESALISIHNSSSWQLTAPFRKIIIIVKNLFHTPKIAKPTIKDQVKLLLAHAKLYINRRPRFKRAILNSPRLRFFARWAINHYPRLRFIARDVLGIESARLNARSFDDLTSIKIMSAMIKSRADTTNTDSVVFLQINHEK